MKNQLFTDAMVLVIDIKLLFFVYFWNNSNDIISCKDLLIKKLIAFKHGRFYNIPNSEIFTLKERISF